MPAKPKDAEAGTDTVTEAEPAADGNVSNRALLDDLAATQELLLRQEEMIQSLAQQVEQLTTQSADSVPPEGPAEVAGPAPLPEGHRRYAARFTELTLVKVAGRRILIDNTPVWEPAVTVDFNGGVYQTEDPEVQRWIENHPDFGITFWADDTAVRRHSLVEVQQGVKSTITTPRVPLAAPMQ